jgi:RNA polymerase sigma-B factor
MHAAAREPEPLGDPRPPAPAAGRRDAELLRRYASTRDPRIRAELVKRLLPLARYAASRYSHRGEQFDDLVQIACVALLKAIDGYVPGRGSTFASYAMPTMRGELARHFRDRCWAVRPPRELQERALRVDLLVDELSARLDRSPSVDELAEEMGVCHEFVLEALHASRCRRAVSLAARTGPEGEEELVDRLVDEDEGFAHVEHRAVIDGVVGVLTDRERDVVQLRFNEDLTQAEIAARVGVSQMQVSRILRRALVKLRGAAAREVRVRDISGA